MYFRYKDKTLIKEYGVGFTTLIKAEMQLYLNI